MGLVGTLRNERYHRQIIDKSKVPTVQVDNEDHMSYYNHLTLEAYKLVSHELSKMSTVTVLNDTLVECAQKHIQVNEHSCTCAFNITRGLPCRHIMAMRNKSGLSTFDPDAVHRRWTKTYNVSAREITSATFQASAVSKSVTKRSLSYSAKYKQASVKLNMIATIMAEYDTQKFNLKMEQVDDMLSLFRENKDFLICEIMNEPFETEDRGVTDDGDQRVESNVQEEVQDQGMNDDGGFVVEVAESEAHQNGDEENGVFAETNITYANLKLPKKGKNCRGRPKGSVTTAIGLPNKRARRCPGPLPFFKKESEAKKKMMLHWFLTQGGLQKYRNGIKCNATDIAPVEYIPGCSLDTVIGKCIYCIRDVFDENGWNELLRVRRERAEIEWECRECGADLDKHASIGCDGCLSWSHMRCLRMTMAPKSRYWYCMTCKEAANQ